MERAEKALVPSRLAPLSRTMTTIITAGRLTQHGLQPQHPPEPPPQYQNTYQLGPKPGDRLRPDTVTRLMKEVMEEEMRDVEAGMDTSHLSCRVANRIKYEVKRRGLIPNHRYKVVVQVSFVHGSGVTVASRSLWDDKTDNSATATFSKSGVAAIATLHVIYFE